MSTTKTYRHLEEMQGEADRLMSLLAPACERIAIAGSIRRRKREVGDIELLAIPKMRDVLLTPPQKSLFEERPQSKIESHNMLWEVLDGAADRIGEFVKRGPKYRQFFWNDAHGGRIQVDLFTAAEDNWGWAFLVRTGSAEFSHHVATQLNNQGYTSQDFRVHKMDAYRKATGNPIPTPHELDPFRLAKLDWIPPEGRSWTPQRKFY